MTRFLLTVWGKAYVDGLMAAVLPSFLAPGNLPTLAERTALEVVIMTTRESVVEFLRHPAFARLEALCPVSFVPIDDLVQIPNYGIVLTTAFARGVMAAGAAQTDIHFVFMNADFVLADGSLRSLAERIAAGERCIMGPSLRASEEQLLPRLAEEARRQDGVLSLSARELVGMALAHPHPTVVAKTVNQALVHSDPCNQLYWRVDETTLLARFYLVFMLCIRPERPLERVCFWCDYGFVPELAPSSPVTTFADSDTFFMLELQKEQTEASFFRLGPLRTDSLARSLDWATAHHRAFAYHDLVFHAGDIPEALAAARADAGRLVGAVAALLPPPADHRDHYYWLSAINALVEHRNRHGERAAWPPELDAQPFRRTRSAAAQSSEDDPFAERPSWHPDAADARLVRRLLKQMIDDGGGPVLLICRAGCRFARALGDDPRFEPVELHAVAAGFLPPSIAAHRYRRVLCHAESRLTRDATAAAAHALPLLADDGTLTVLLQHDPSDSDDLSQSMMAIASASALIPGALGIDARFVGGALRRRLRRRERKYRRWIRESRGVRSLLGWLGLAHIRVRAVITDRQQPDPGQACPVACSTAALTLRRPEPAVDGAAAKSVPRDRTPALRAAYSSSK